MMANLLLLKNCTLADGTKKNILIENDRISKISDTLNPAAQAIDCINKTIIPGIIDIHTHIRDMGLSEKEDWLSASQAAAVGGVTSIFDMPNTKPATFDVESLQQKRQAAQKSIVNYGYNFGVTEYNTDEIRKASPIASLKMFMAESSSGYVVEKEETIREVFKIAREINKPVIIHSELQSCVEKHEKLFEPTLANHLNIRNRECAINATKLVIKLARETGARIYLAHISTAEEIAMIRQAKRSGLTNLFCETAPHYVFINERILDKVGNYGKVNPPIRTAKDNQAVIDGIIDGTVDTIGTDHAPHKLSEKDLDYSSAPSGFPGLETAFGLMMQLVRKRKISFKRLTELMSANPANIFRISDRGEIREGAYADLTLVDTDLTWQVNPENFYTKAKYSPYSGMELNGKAILTIVNGNVIWQDNKINDIKGKEVEFT